MSKKSMIYNLITNRSSKLKEKEIVKLVTQVKQLTSQPIVNTGKGLDNNNVARFLLYASLARLLCGFVIPFILTLLKITFEVSKLKYLLD